jgi:excisionase family DNA binding protein
MAEPRAPRARLLTIEEAAEQLGVTPRMIRRLTESRRLPFVKVGRLVRIRDTDIGRCVEEWTVPAVGHRWSA